MRVEQYINRQSKPVLNHLVIEQDRHYGKVITLKSYDDYVAMIDYGTSLITFSSKWNNTPTTKKNVCDFMFKNLSGIFNSVNLPIDHIIKTMISNGNICCWRVIIDPILQLPEEV